MESVRRRLLLVAPLRLVLAGGLFAAARAAGTGAGPAYLVFIGGAFAMAVLISQDPRARFRPAAGDPEPLPDDAQLAPAWLHAAHAALPSTVGVTVLAVAALAFEPALAALLAGVLAGLGFAAAAVVHRIDPGLYFDPRTGALFLKH